MRTHAFLIGLATALMLPLAPGGGLFADDSQAAALEAPRAALDSSFKLSSVDGLGLELRAEAGEVEALLSAEGLSPSDRDSRARGAVALPCLRAGAVDPSGLSAFMRRPTGAGPALIERLGAPLEIRSPGDAPWLAASVGDQWGALVLSPFSEPGRSAFCAWLSPDGGHLSAIVGAVDEPAEAGGPGWYDAPSPRSTRAIYGIAASGSGRGWGAAGAGAASLGFPGADSGALRLEGRVSWAGFRAEAEAAATFGAWRGLSGETCDALRAELEARWSRRGSALTAGGTIVKGSWDEAAVCAASGRFEAAGGFGSMRSSAKVTVASGEAAELDLSASLRPGFARWLRVSWRWTAADWNAELLELGSAARIGGKYWAELEGSLKFVPEGRFVDFDARIGARLGASELILGFGSDGWKEPGSVGWETLEYAARGRIFIDAGPALYRRRVSRYSAPGDGRSGLEGLDCPPADRRGE